MTPLDELKPDALVNGQWGKEAVRLIRALGLADREAGATGPSRKGTY
jgi:hypothetical protein